jgi:hypothetical protein
LFKYSKIIAVKTATFLTQSRYLQAGKPTAYLSTFVFFANA